MFSLILAMALTGQVEARLEPLQYTTNWRLVKENGLWWYYSDKRGWLYRTNDTWESPPSATYKKRVKKDNVWWYNSPGGGMLYWVGDRWVTIPRFDGFRPHIPPAYKPTKPSFSPQVFEPDEPRYHNPGNDRPFPRPITPGERASGINMRTGKPLTPGDRSGGMVRDE